MTRSRFAPMLLATTLFGAGFNMPTVQAGENTTFHPLLYSAGGLATGPCHAFGLLNLPATWSVGDGAVVLMTAPGFTDRTRDQLVAALLDQHAAVLEVVAGATARCARDDAAGARADAVAEFSGALRALTQFGAAVVVAIGYGAEGNSAIASLSAPGTSELRFAAAIAISGREARFARGAPPGAAERWGDRALALCGAMAAGIGAADRGTESATLARTCLDAVMPSEIITGSVWEASAR